MSYLDNESAQKKIHNEMFLEAVKIALSLQTTDKTSNLKNLENLSLKNYNLFVLDGVETRTCKMLIDAGVPATNIHSPNYDNEAFQNLNKLGVNTTHTAADKYIMGRPDIKYIAIYYDGMATIEGSIDSSPLIDLNSLVSQETKVLYGTFAVRSKYMYNFEHVRIKNEVFLKAMLQTKQMYASKINNINYRKDEQSSSMNFISMNIMLGNSETPVHQTSVNIFLNIICGKKEVVIESSAKPTNKPKVVAVHKGPVVHKGPTVRKPAFKRNQTISKLWPTSSVRPTGITAEERKSPEYKIVHSANIKTGKRQRTPSRPFVV